MSSRPIPIDLQPWALESLPGAAGEEVSLTVIAGDASSRRYFRLDTAMGTYIVVEAPPATEKNAEFVAVRALLERAGVRVPALFALDQRRGYMLLEDLGEQTLLPLLSAETSEAYYGCAFDLLFAMGRIDLEPAEVSVYDRALLSEELSRFDQWFVSSLLGYTLADSERALILRFGQLLVGSALQQPQVLVHRDFHSRNLMVDEEGQLAVIDFQDAVLGPITYDLASLLRDCYIRWPAPRVRQWALDYRDSLVSLGMMERVEDREFLRWFDWMGLQRHIKVLGTFARLFLRDGKTAYLQDLPLVLRYVEEILDFYADDEPLFREFRQWFGQNLSPLIAPQDWSGQS